MAVRTSDLDRFGVITSCEQIDSISYLLLMGAVSLTRHTLRALGCPHPTPHFTGIFSIISLMFVNLRQLFSKGYRPRCCAGHGLVGIYFVLGLYAYRRADSGGEWIW